MACNAECRSLICGTGAEDFTLDLLPQGKMETKNNALNRGTGDIE